MSRQRAAISTRLFALFLLAVLLVCVVGCGTRHVYIQPGTRTVLRIPIKSADIDAPDENGKLTPGTAAIPAGAVIHIPAANIKLEGK